MKRLIKNWTIHRIVLLLFLLLCLFVTVFCRGKFGGESVESAISWDTESDSGIEDMDSYRILKQIFYPEHTILEYIYIAVGTHGQTGTMVVSVYDGTDRRVAVRKIPCSQMVENGAQGVPFSIRVKAGKEYYYTVEFQGVEDVYPVVRTAKCLSGELGTFYLDGEPQDTGIFGLFVGRDDYRENPLWRICVLITVLMVLFLVFYPVIPVWETRLLPVFLALHAALAVFLLEWTAGTDVLAISRERMLYNWLLCGMIFIVLALFIWNGRGALALGTVFCMILGIAEYYVLKFRGTPLVLSDLRSIGTAAEVGGNYQFDIPPEMMTAVLIMTAILMLESKMRFCRYHLRGRILFSTGLLLFGAGSFFYLKQLPLLNTGKNGGFFWNLADSYQKYGFFLSTYIYENYQVVKKPEGYSPDGARKLLEEAEGERKQEEINTSDFPNIIVIMNESFTDFASVGGLETSCPVTPFVDSLTENTVRGNLYVSVFGGGTANTEFEFLTGSTMNFLPSGSTPYQVYIKKELPSLASVLKEWGYIATVYHFGARGNWNRDRVYPLLGFEEYVSQETAENLEYIHGYPSDASNYREVLRRYETWKKEKESDHFFCFNITIQNHGGYSFGYRCDDPPHYQGEKTWDDVEEYLSLLRASDKAFEDLVHYFEKEEEPVILLFFGDHWPRLNNQFIRRVVKQADAADDLERNQNKYVTPFVLWANYDIEERQIDRLSANYLSTLLLKTAGIPLNNYHRFLDRLSGEMPVIDGLGFIDASGKGYAAAEEMGKKQAELVRDYQILQYDNLFGKK